MSKIYDLTTGYKLVRGYINFMFKQHYGEIVVTGQENIPADCPVIFAPNHTNALMDALAVTSTVPQNRAVVFLARADLFKHPVMARILQFTKIMPAFRMRDGVENLGKNQEIFDRCMEVLDKGHSLCIMPEGNQEVERKLRPLVKGIFRIAFATQEKKGRAPYVKIIPVGLDYGSSQKFGKHLIVRYGKPIEVSEFMIEYNDNPVVATNQIRDRLKQELHHLTFDLASDAHYESFEHTTEYLNTTILDQMKLDNNSMNRLYARQEIARVLVHTEKKDPQKAARIAELSDAYHQELQKHGLRNWLFEKRRVHNSSILTDVLLLIINFPFAAYGFLMNIVPFYGPVLIRKYILKPEFTGFYSSIHYALGALMFPICWLLELIIFGSIFKFHLWQAFVFIVTLWALGKWALMYYSLLRKTQGKIRYKALSKKNKERIKSLRNEMVELVAGK